MHNHRVEKTTPIHFHPTRLFRLYTLQQRWIHIPLREVANMLKRMLFSFHRNFDQRQIGENDDARFLIAPISDGERFETGQFYPSNAESIATLHV